MWRVVLKPDWEKLYSPGGWPSNQSMIRKYQNNLYASEDKKLKVSLYQHDNPQMGQNKEWLNQLSNNHASIPKSGILKLIKIGD